MWLHSHDVASLMHKQRQDMKRFESQPSPGPRGRIPAVFSSVNLSFRIEGDVDPALAVEAVRCRKHASAISAMLSRTVPIRYQCSSMAHLWRGEAQFAPIYRSVPAALSALAFARACSPGTTARSATCPGATSPTRIARWCPS